MELRICVCTSFHLCQLFTDHWRGWTSFLSSEVIFYLILSYFILFYSILLCFKIFVFNFVLFSSRLPCKSFLLSSFLVMNCGIHTNRKWNYGHLSLLPFICVSCSLTVEEVGRHSVPLKQLFILFYLFYFIFYSFILSLYFIKFYFI